MPTAPGRSMWRVTGEVHLRCGGRALPAFLTLCFMCGSGCRCPLVSIMSMDQYDTIAATPNTTYKEVEDCPVTVLAPASDRSNAGILLDCSANFSLGTGDSLALADGPTVRSSSLGVYTTNQLLASVVKTTQGKCCVLVDCRCVWEKGLLNHSCHCSGLCGLGGFCWCAQVPCQCISGRHPQPILGWSRDSRARFGPCAQLGDGPPPAGGTPAPDAHLGSPVQDLAPPQVIVCSVQRASTVTKAPGHARPAQPAGTLARRVRTCLCAVGSVWPPLAASVARVLSATLGMGPTSWTASE